MSEKDFDKGYKSGFKFGKEVANDEWLNKIKQAREDISKSCYKACMTDDGDIKESKVLEILDKLIESEGAND